MNALFMNISYEQHFHRILLKRVMWYYEPKFILFTFLDMNPDTVYVPQTLVAADAPPAYQSLDVTGLMAEAPEDKMAPLDADSPAVHQ